MFWQVFAVGNDEAGHAFLCHLQGEVVGIEVLSFESEKDVIFPNLSAVGSDFIGFLEILVYLLDHIFVEFGPFDKLRDPYVVNERSRLNRSNGFNTIMKKNLTTYLVKELPTLFIAQRKPMVEADWFWLR